jgi:DNA helicase-2/ATP-dependent DNA helicase PcrA
MSPSPESTSALDNIEELLNTMQLFKEQRDAQLRNGELDEGEGEATIDEWLQNVMLLTDMDKDDPDDRNKVTLMTVHAAKGLEFKYVYIVGMEDDLFPSQRAVESMEGIEEERRLFYVALTRAKRKAVLSFSETRFKWGSMEFCRPSRFLGEIDRRYLDVAFDLEEERKVDRSEQPSAIEQLRQRFDYRYKSGAQPSSGGQHGGYERRSERGERPNYGGQRGSFGGGEQRPRPSMVVEPARPSNLRRISGSGAVAGAPSGGGSATNICAGMRVEHAKFGTGVVLGIEPASQDMKITVRFDDPQIGKKSLLAKFAKLKVLA